MQIARIDSIDVHFREDGPATGPAVVFANSLGTDLRLWDPILPHLPKGLRLIRYDKRGHGLTSCPPAPYAMGRLITDAERLIEHLGLRDVVFVGLSIGGMIAQGLAAKRPDLLKAIVLSNTGAKLGTPAMWQDRIDAVGAGGIAAISDAILERWFSKAFLKDPALPAWRHMLERQPNEGYIGCSAAIQGTDLITPTSGLTLPTLAIAGSEDGASPPDVVRETAELIQGAQFHLMRGAGHLPCVEAPEAYAQTLTGFLEEVGHV